MENEPPGPVFEVGYKSHPRGSSWEYLDEIRLHAIRPQALEDAPSKLVFADAADDSSRMTQAGNRVDEDSGGTAGIGSLERSDLLERQPGFRPHDLDEELAHDPDIAHGQSFRSNKRGRL